MSKEGESPLQVMLLPHEHAEIAALAKECEMRPEHWLADTVRIALAERRDFVAPVRQREREVAKLKAEVVRLTQALMMSKNGVSQ